MWVANHAHQLIAAVLSGILIGVAATDILDRRIPNIAVLSLLGLFVLWAAADGGATLITGLAAGAIGVTIGYLLYVFGVMGAGDVKLFSAVALFVGLGSLHLFALATALTGGVIALSSMIARPRRALVMLTLRGKGDYGRGIPYGVAIAVGGLLVVWGSLTGTLPPDFLNRL